MINWTVRPWRPDSHKRVSGKPGVVHIHGARHLSQASSNPLVTFAIFAFNQEQYIEQAVNAALAQTYSPLEIIISDDCSTDGTFEIIQKTVQAYNGPHKIKLNRNEINLNIGGHVSFVFKISTGDLVVMAAGDDISLPQRTSEIVHAWLQFPKTIMSLYSNAIRISEKGDTEEQVSVEYTKNIEKIITHPRQNHVLGCAHACSRDLFDIFGPLRPEIVNEDNAIPFRACLLGEVKKIDKELVLWRRCRSDWKEWDPEHKNTQDDKVKFQKLLFNLRLSAGLQRQFRDDLEKLRKINPKLSDEYLPLARREAEKSEWFLEFNSNGFLGAVKTAGIMGIFKSSWVRAFIRYLKRHLRLAKSKLWPT